MTDQDKLDVIRVLKELGFEQGASALLSKEKMWVILESNPFFFVEPEAHLPDKNDYNSAHVRIKTVEGVHTTVKVVNLESPHTAKNKIDVLIDDIKNNPTPVKEAWVLELEQIKVWCDANDAIKERRANQLILLNEAARTESWIKEDAPSEQVRAYSLRAAFLRKAAKSFDNPNKLTIDEPLGKWYIPGDPIIKEKQAQIIAKIEDVLGRGAMYYSELTILLNQLKELNRGRTN